MADELEAGSFGNQDHLKADDELLYARPASGVGGNVPASVIFAQRYSGGPVETSSNALIPIGRCYNTYNDNLGFGTPDQSGLQIFTGSGDSIRFGTRSNGVFTDILRILSSGTLFPTTNGTIALGGGSNRFSTVYLATAPTVGSDATLKTDNAEIDIEVLDRWSKVTWSQYRLRDAVAEKGDDARLHAGAVAQQIIEAMGGEQAACKWGLVCKEEWPAEFAPKISKKTGKPLKAKGKKLRDAGSLWMLRYEECFAMEAAYQRLRADRLEARIDAIEARLVAAKD